MKITSLETDLDQIAFLLLQPSVVRTLDLHAGLQSAVPESCKAVVSCMIFRSGEPVEGINQDRYIKGFAYCSGVDKFCVVKGMKVALENAAEKFRELKLPSPWIGVMKSQLRNVFVGDEDAIAKMNLEVKKRVTFDPYTPDFNSVIRQAVRDAVNAEYVVATAPNDWAKRPRKTHVKLSV